MYETGPTDSGSASYRPAKLPIAVFASALFLITLFLYAPVRNFGFINYDDDHHVAQNPIVLSGITPRSLKWAFFEIHVSYWHPLTWISHMVDVEMWGSYAGGHHVTSVLIHAANSVLLFLFLRAITGASGRSAFVAAIFAWHPLHVESVAWVAERKDVLSAFFWIISSAAYAWYVRNRSGARYSVVVVFFLCGLMSKPMLVTFPLVLLLLDYWPLQRARLVRADSARWLKLALEKLPLLLLAAVSSWLTLIMQSRFHETKTVVELPLQLRVANALISYVKYLSAAFYPSNLAVFYPAPRAIPVWQSATAALLLISVTILSAIWARRRPYLLVGWLWFGGMLMPVIGLIQIGSYARADRYMYLPLVGLSIAVGWGIHAFVSKFPLRRFGLAFAAGAAAFGCVVKTAKQLPVWDNSISLYRHGAAVTAKNGELPLYPFYFDGLADAYLRIGDLQQAEKLVSETERKYPEHPKRLNLSATIEMGLGRPSEAEQLWTRALELDPKLYPAYNGLAILYVKANRLDEARLQFERLLALRPGDAIALGNLAQLCLLQRDYKRATLYCEQGLAENPSDPVLQQLRTAITREAGRIR